MRIERLVPFSRYIIALVGIFLGGGAPSPLQGQAPTQVPSQAIEWVGTWGTGPQLTEPNNMPPAPGLTGNTIRQIVQVSIGGSRLRLHLSNAFGDAPMTIRGAHLALSLGEGAVDPTKGVRLTFSGAGTVTIPVGGVVVSDPFDFALTPRASLAVTLSFGEVPAALTGHPGSRTTSFILPGDIASAATMPDAVRTDHWYVITGLDVVAPGSAAVVTLGNSITDGRGSGTNLQNRWPDELSKRLLADPRTDHVAVLNMGIGGNCVIRACLGPAAVERLQWDVLDRSGVRWLLILEGVNDIGQASAENAPRVAQGLIEAYGQMIERAHAAGIRVYGATILPFGGSFYDTPEREAARQTVNAWIRSSGAFDAVVDFDLALRNPDAPTRLIQAGDTGDGLHPNEEGYRRMAAFIDLNLFVDR